MIRIVCSFTLLMGLYCNAWHKLDNQALVISETGDRVELSALDDFGQYLVARYLDVDWNLSWELPVQTSREIQISQAVLQHDQVFVSGSFSGRLDLDGISLHAQGEADLFLAVIHRYDGRLLRLLHLSGAGRLQALGLVWDTDQLLLVGRSEAGLISYSLNVELTHPYRDALPSLTLISMDAQANLFINPGDTGEDPGPVGGPAFTNPGDTGEDPGPEAVPTFTNSGDTVGDFGPDDQRDE